jgi:hypothetical protein
MVPPFMHIVQLRSDSSITGQARMILLCHLGGMLWVASLARHTGPWGVYSQGLNCNLDAVSWYSARSGVAARTEPFTAQTSALMCGFLSYYHTLPSQLPSINTIEQSQLQAMISNLCTLRQEGKTNLSHDGLNPAHVPC